MIKFEAPEMEVEKFELLDVITTSVTACDTDCSEFDCQYATELG